MGWRAVGRSAGSAAMIALVPPLADVPLFLLPPGDRAKNDGPPEMRSDVEAVAGQEQLGARLLRGDGDTAVVGGQPERLAAP